MKTLIEMVLSFILAVGLLIFAIRIITFMIAGLHYLPQYIGEFGTFLLYGVVFAIILSILCNIKNKTK